jgi:hypothetical protein
MPGGIYINYRGYNTMYPVNAYMYHESPFRSGIRIGLLVFILRVDFLPVYLIGHWWASGRSPENQNSII